MDVDLSFQGKRPASPSIRAKPGWSVWVMQLALVCLGCARLPTAPLLGPADQRDSARTVTRVPVQLDDDKLAHFSQGAIRVAEWEWEWQRLGGSTCFGETSTQAPPRPSGRSRGSIPKA